ncbi:helix-turn-helix transcriptional regulator [Salinisphaera orenii]|uniref:helix-turn-helix transcriptional regulator n=1 Tax=Salinisphaera orenii TaxID=856731 RepID=UPI000F4C7109|nr:helix-turn-helix domain-containing protein [Salinisphaera orenii]
MNQESKSALLAEYYTRQELAEELGITQRSLERWAWLRKGPAQTRIGQRVYYHRSAVEKWLSEQTEAAA